MRSIVLITALMFVPAVPAQISFSVPSQFATAKTVFIAYRGNYSFAGITNEKILASFQDAFDKEHRFRQTLKPADAELSMTLTTEEGGFQLATYDTKSNVLLWSVYSNFNPLGLTKNIPSKLARATQDLVDQVEVLAAGKIPQCCTK